jgi:hypothetical protein
MAVPGLTTPPDWPPAAVAVIDGYLTRLGARLPGPGRTRTAILAEIGDGLIEATDKHLAHGLEPGMAARVAVAEFGDADALARAFAGELAAGTAQRIGLGLIVTGPAVGVAWLTAWRQHTGLGWLAQISAIPASAPLLLAVLAVGVPAALFAARHGFGGTPRRVTAVAFVACGAAAAGDASLLAGSVSTVSTWSWPFAVALAASLIRLTVVGAAARRCAARRAAAG